MLFKSLFKSKSGSGISAGQSSLAAPGKVSRGLNQLLLPDLFLLLFLVVSPLSASVPELYEEIRIHNAKIESRLASWYERARLHYDQMNTSTNPRIVVWREQLVELDFQEEVAALKKLNEFVNADIDYVDDYHHFHKTDYWADPETALTEGGDCEDIALVKAATLGRFNWPGDKMHLLVGFLTERGKKESHAVLLVETSDGDQLVMRSIIDDIVPLSEFQFVPVYAVDRYGTLIVKSKSPHHLLHTEKTARQEKSLEAAE